MKSKQQRIFGDPKSVKDTIEFFNLRALMRSLLEEQIEARRVDALTLCTPSDIVLAPKEQCLQIQSLLGWGEAWGQIELPSDWMPPGSEQNNRKLDLVSRFASTGASIEAQELAILQVTRFGLIYFLVAMPTPRGRILPTPVTWKDNMRVFSLIADAGLRKSGGSPSCILSHLTIAEITTLNRGRRIGGILQKLSYASRQYGWKDRPIETTSSENLEPDRQGASRPQQSVPKDSGFRALPDTFIAQAGWRVTWLIEQMAPDLIKCAKEMQAVIERFPLTGGNKYTLRSRRIKALQGFLSSRQWADASGNPLNELPFPIYLGGSGRRLPRGPMEWPPRLPLEIQELLKLAQLSSLFVFLLSTGGRISEVMSLRRGCLVHEPNEVARVQGRTYKLVFSDQGQLREWPIPTLGLTALRQQEELATVLDRMGPLYKVGNKRSQILNEAPAQSPPLWVRLASEGKEMTADYQVQLELMVRTLGLTEVMDDVPLHAHRFRKSIARLIALAIVAGAPKILMDLFGHQSIEMTLHYILADPAIRSEMEEVAKAQIIMLATDAITDADANGGPAAKRIREVVAQERARKGEQFGESDIYSLAQTFTFSGQVWELVRPGVICTKGPHQSGPCNKRLGHPEPSRCRAGCDHRLETLAARDDVERLLQECVTNLERAESEEDEITAEHWRGQVLANVRRFPDLEQRWSTQPSVAALLQSMTHGNKNDPCSST